MKRGREIIFSTFLTRLSLARQREIFVEYLYLWPTRRRFFSTVHKSSVRIRPSAGSGDGGREGGPG